MKESDFVFDRIEGGKYCDYWFRVTGETKEELTDRYMEQSMVEVTEAVFSIQDGQWGIKRLFPFNYDVITPSDDKELYTTIKNVAFKTLREQNMNCKDIRFGTYDCAYNIMLPWLTTDPCNPNEPPKPYTAAIDKCLLPEILKLWEMGIKTTGCCCGHGKPTLAFIGVLPEYIPRMKELGYQVQFNSCRPNDEDSFVPKTDLKYGSADKGFNWWDK